MVLLWLNQQYIKQASTDKLVSWVELAFSRKNIRSDSIQHLTQVVELQKDRVKTFEAEQSTHPTDNKIKIV